MILLLAKVKNIKTKTLSPTAVRVSWNSVVGIPELTGYIVYYTGDLKRRNISVNSSDTYVDIEGLLYNVKYKFQVAVLAVVNGEEFMGELAVPSRTGIQTFCENFISCNDAILIKINYILFSFNMHKELWNSCRCSIFLDFDHVTDHYYTVLLSKGAPLEEYYQVEVSFSWYD